MKCHSLLRSGWIDALQISRHSVDCLFNCPGFQYKLSGLCKCLIVLICCLLTGISGKSQVLFALVFTTRYLDLLTSFISLYNTTMKVKHSHLTLHPAGLFPSTKHIVLRLNKYTKSTRLCLLKDDVAQQDVTN